MQRIVGNASRIRLMLALLLALGFTARVEPSASARQSAVSNPLDLGAMVLNASDLAEVQLDGFRVRGSQAIDSSELATRYAGQLGSDTDDLIAAFDETSIVWSFDAALDRIPEPDDPSSVTTDRVYSYLSEHVDADGAAADFALRTKGASSGGEEATPDAPEFGDESVLTRFTGQSADDNRLFLIGYDFTFRIDRVVAGVQLIAFDERADRIVDPELDDVEALAKLLVERVERGLDGETPGMSTQVVRVQLPANPDNETLDMYESLEGDAFAYIGMSDASLDDLMEQIEQFGITSRYRVEQTLATGPGTGSEQSSPYMVLRLSAFASESDAANWVSEAATRMQDDPSITRAEVVDDTNPLGDAFVAVAYEIESGDDVISGNAVILQFGDFAFSLEVDSASLEAVIDLATIQLECLEDGICPILDQAPASIVNPS